jgi:hypothetical protein
MQYNSVLSYAVFTVQPSLESHLLAGESPANPLMREATNNLPLSLVTTWLDSLRYMLKCN